MRLILWHANTGNNHSSSWAYALLVILSLVVAGPAKFALRSDCMLMLMPHESENRDIHRKSGGFIKAPTNPSTESLARLQPAAAWRSTLRATGLENWQVLQPTMSKTPSERKKRQQVRKKNRRKVRKKKWDTGHLVRVAGVRALPIFISFVM